MWINYSQKLRFFCLLYTSIEWLALKGLMKCPQTCVFLHLYNKLLTTLKLRLTASITTVSPFSNNAIGPPDWASGVTWPIIIPWEAPLKRPSVTKATLFPSPAPIRAAPGPSISGIPGLLSKENTVNKYFRWSCLVLSFWISSSNFSHFVSFALDESRR